MIKSKIIMLIALVILFALSPIIITNFSYITGDSNETAQYNDDMAFDNKNLKIAATSRKIHIDNNWTATKSAGICTGNGTYSQPYVIEDLVMDAGTCGSRILIENSIVYFKIENCIIINLGGNCNAGIRLSHVNNSQIINNECSSNYWGIILEHCYNNTLSGNTVNYNNYAIYLMESNNNIVSRNVLFSNTECVTEVNCKGNIFENNDCSGGVVSGYNIFFLLGILSVITVIISRKLKKS